MATSINITALLVVLLVSIVCLFIFRKKRHQWYIRRARQIYNRINSRQEQYAPGQLMLYLRTVNPYVFEELLLHAFSRKGYKVIHNLRYSGDGGIDGYVIVDGKRIPIQAKRYKSYIRREHVVAFARIVERRRKPFGFFIHTGRTGKVNGDPSSSLVRIISGEKLLNLLYTDRTFRF